MVDLWVQLQGLVILINEFAGEVHEGLGVRFVKVLNMIPALVVSTLVLLQLGVVHSPAYRPESGLLAVPLEGRVLR